MGPILQGTSMVGQEVARELVVEQVEQGQHQGSAEVGRAAQEEGEVAAAEVATDSEEDEEIASQELRRGLARLRSESPRDMEVEEARGPEKEPQDEQVGQEELEIEGVLAAAGVLPSPRQAGHGVGGDEGGGREERGDRNRDEEREVPEVPVLPGLRRVVRGVEGGKEDVSVYLDPVMPAVCQVLLGGDSFAQVDRLDAWDCTLSVFHPMEEIPECLKVKWGRITAEVLRRIEEATSDTELTRALKWWLVLPQALLNGKYT